MIVVADTSPLSYLILIGEIDLLVHLFGRIFVPEAVVEELRHPAVPETVAGWLREPPPWLSISPTASQEVPPELESLDVGEREAILLARALQADLLIVDDKAARIAARRLGLTVTGTLGVLEVGARRGLIDLRATLGRLRTTNFRVAPRLLAHLLERNP